MNLFPSRYPDFVTLLFLVITASFLSAHCLYLGIKNLKTEKTITLSANNKKKFNQKRTLVWLMCLLLFSSPLITYAYVYEQKSSNIFQTILDSVSNFFDFVDNNTSDVDISSDEGVHFNFTAQQYGPDSDYDILTEQRSFFTNSTPNYAVSGSASEITGSPDSNYATISKGASCSVIDYQGGSGTIQQVYFNITYYGSVSGTLAWAYQLDNGGWINIEDLPEGGTSVSPLTRTYNATGLRALWTWSNLNTTDIQFQNNDAGGPENAYVDSIYLTIIAEFPDHTLDLEVQWTDVEYDLTNEELAIYFENGTNTHSLDATGGYMKVGDGTPDWGSTKGTISYWIKWDTMEAAYIWGQHNDMEMWVGVSAGPTYKMAADWGNLQYIISSTELVAEKWYFIAIVWNEDTDELSLYIGDENNPPTLNAKKLGWTAEVSILDVTENNFLSSSGGKAPSDCLGDDLRYYDIDRTLEQIQSDYLSELTGSEPNLRSYFKLNNDFNDVGPANAAGSGVGSYRFSSSVPFDPSPSEDLEVDVWTGSSWQNLIPSLNRGWNNVTISDHLTSSTFTIRFKGNNETADVDQERWLIDTALIHVWN